MDNTKNIVQEWTHGLTALILGLFLLGVSSSLGVVKTLVDLCGAVLSIPEHPAVIAREIYLNWQEWVRDKKFLNEELERLKEENSRLRIQIAKINSNENHEGQNQEIKTKIARVTLRAPMSWWSEIRIDRGEQDKITPGLPVFYNGYLIGRVSSVSLMS